MKLKALIVQDEQGIHLNKKGISPLIATVLLIGFVIMMAILIWFWWNKVLKEQAEKIGEQSTADWICANEVEFSASNGDLVGMKVTFDAENIGERSIDYFKVRIDTDGGSAVVNTAYGLTAGSISSFDVEFSDSVTGTSIEIIPAVRVNNKDSFCTEKALTLNI